MRTCQKCGELNGNTNVRCWKCNTFLGTVENRRKICPKCGALYSFQKETCEECGTRLSVYDGSSEEHKSQSGNGWLYVLSFFIPLVGIILGCVYIAKDEDELGKSLLIFTVVCWILMAVFAAVLSSCLGSL